MEYIKIPITQEMKDDLEECSRMADDGEEKDCHECSLDGGDNLACLAGYDWLEGMPEVL